MSKVRDSIEDLRIIDDKAPLASPVFTGNVGIGTSSPSQDLEILNGTAGAGIRLAATDTAYWDIERSATTGNLNFTDDAAGTVLTLDQVNGNVGIGTSSIDFASAGRTVVHVEGSAGALLALEDTGAKSYLFQTGNDLLIENDTPTGDMVFGTGSSTERMRIDAAGIVTTPNQPAFDVSSSSGGSQDLTGIISHPTTYIDRGNDHNGTRFTAPVTGVYHFYTSHIKNAPSATVGRRRFLVNGVVALNDRHQRLDETSTGYNGGGTFSMLINLSVGDYIEVDQFAGASHGGWEYDYFGGHLIG